MRISKDIIRSIEVKAKKIFKESSACHDWTHVERVRLLGKRIAKAEEAREDIVEVSALLHDIGRYAEMESSGETCHATNGERIARSILSKYPIPESDKENILHSIGAHRYRGSRVPETLEAKCLYDSDKLDSIGAVGVARDFLFAGYIGVKVPGKMLYTGREKKIAGSGKCHSYTKEDSAILEYEIKLKYIKGKMLTKTGKKIALDRDRFMRDYFKRFWDEVKGNK